MRVKSCLTLLAMAIQLCAASAMAAPPSAAAPGPAAPTTHGPATPPATPGPAAPATPGPSTAPAAPAPAGSAAAPPASPDSPAANFSELTGQKAPSVAAPGTPVPADTRGLDEETQALKKDVVELNRDLFVLEEELLFPANTQVAVFLSMDVGEFFAIDTVTLKIDQKEVANYLYTPREADALLKGGVHRLYLGNLKVGGHELVAFFTGKGPNDRPYKRGASIKFEKGIGAKYLELKINDRQRKLQPEFEIKDWE